VGSALTSVFLALVFTALPGGWFANLRRVEWDWGCPLPVFFINHFEGGTTYGFWDLWYYLLPLDLVFWTLVFFFLAIVASAISRKAGGRVRPFYALAAFACLTGVAYSFVYREVWQVFIFSFY
jgi:hypothetical protein